MRSLLIAAEKVSQVTLLVKQGKRRSLQDAVQLLVAMEEVDMPQLFLICRDIMRATDRALAHQLAHQRARERASTEIALDAHGARLDRMAHTVSFSSKHHHAPDGAAAAAEVPVATIWWHQIDDENDESYELKDFTEWHATKDLRKARLHLMNNRAADGVAALDKIRGDLLLYARDAA